MTDFEVTRAGLQPNFSGAAGFGAAPPLQRNHVGAANRLLGGKRTSFAALPGGKHAIDGTLTETCHSELPAAPLRNKRRFDARL